MKKIWLIIGLLLISVSAFAANYVNVIVGRSSGPTLGSEKVYNYSFTSTDGWGLLNENIYISGGDLYFTTTWGRTDQLAGVMLSSLQPGESYRVTADKETHTGNINVGAISTSYGCLLPNASGIQTCDFTYSAASADGIDISGTGTATVGVLHSVSIKRIMP